MPDEPGAAAAQPDILTQLAQEEGRVPSEGDNQPSDQPAWAGRFQSPDAVWQGYQNLEAKFNERNDEVGSLRREAQELREWRQQVEPYLQQLQQGAPYGGQPQPQQQPAPIDMIGGFSKDQLASLAFEDPVQFHRLMAERERAETINAVAQAVAPLLDQRFAPLEQELAGVSQYRVRGESQEAYQALRAELGPDADRLIEENREALVRRMSEDKAFFSDPETRTARLRDAVLASAYQRGAGQSVVAVAAPSGPGSVYVEPGTTGMASVLHEGAPQHQDADVQRLLAFQQDRDPFGRKPE